MHKYTTTTTTNRVRCHTHTKKKLWRNLSNSNFYKMQQFVQCWFIYRSLFYVVVSVVVEQSCGWLACLVSWHILLYIFTMNTKKIPEYNIFYVYTLYTITFVQQRFVVDYTIITVLLWHFYFKKNIYIYKSRCMYDCMIVVYFRKFQFNVFFSKLFLVVRISITFFIILNLFTWLHSVMLIFYIQMNIINFCFGEKFVLMKYIYLNMYLNITWKNL